MVVRTQDTPTNFAELVARLGDIPLDRIRTRPAPGSATEEDLLKAQKPTCELIDGVLVEKAMGDGESLLAMYIGRQLGNHVDAGDLGALLGADGVYRLEGRQLRAPDVSFIPWSAFPDGEAPMDEAYWSVTPALIVEVLSPRNTTAEIDRKLREFFAVGTSLAWVVDPRARSARVYTSLKRMRELDSTGMLDGGKVLPGFKLPLADLFAKSRPRKKKPR
jgi:Uma2 family endonuclease